MYRHFPDRRALLEGLSQRVQDLGDVNPAAGFQSIDDFAPASVRLMAALDAHYAAASAEAVFNADPRGFSADTQANTRQFREVVSEGFPELDEREQLRIAAVLRCLVSSQAWLRMRRGVRGPRHRVRPGRGVGHRHHPPRAAHRQPPRLIIAAGIADADVRADIRSRR